MTEVIHAKLTDSAAHFYDVAIAIHRLFAQPNSPIEDIFQVQGDDELIDIVVVDGQTDVVLRELEIMKAVAILSQ